MDKAGVRAAIRARRAEGHRPSADYVERVLAATPRGIVCCYVALPGEPPTTELIEALLARGDDVYLPVAGPGGLMSWAPARTSRPWRAWGLNGAQTPQTQPLPTPDAVILPALAVDRQGHRLGQGGGYYDRFIPAVPGARTVALVWSDEVLEHVPAERHDIRVDAWVVADG